MKSAAEVPVGGQTPAPLRILYVLNTGASGGSAGSLRFLIAAMTAGSVETCVICPEGPAVQQFRAIGSEVRLIPGVAMLQSIAGAPLRGWRWLTLLRSASFLRHGRIVERAIREFRPHVVHLNERGMFQAARLARRAGVPVIMHARSVADRQSSVLRRLCDALTRRWVTQIVAIDESVRWSIREQEPCTVIHNPLPPKRTLSAWRPDPSGRTRITYLTGLLPFKGIWELLEAARMLQSRRDVVFQIAGANSRPREFFRTVPGRVSHALGLASDIEKEVRRWVERHELEDTVKLLGQVHDPDALLADTDIMVFPSHLNGPGRSVFEAGARGIPSIVALSDRFDDVIADGVTGLVIPPRDAGALAIAVAKLADDPALCRRLGNAARHRCSERFAPEPIALQMVALYRAIARRSPPSQA